MKRLDLFKPLFFIIVIVEGLFLGVSHLQPVIVAVTGSAAYPPINYALSYLLIVALFFAYMPHVSRGNKNKNLAIYGATLIFFAVCVLGISLAGVWGWQGFFCGVLGGFILVLVSLVWFSALIDYLGVFFKQFTINPTKLSSLPTKHGHRLLAQCNTAFIPTKSLFFYAWIIFVVPGLFLQLFPLGLIVFSYADMRATGDSAISLTEVIPLAGLSFLGITIGATLVCMWWSIIVPRWRLLIHSLAGDAIEAIYELNSRGNLFIPYPRNHWNERLELHEPGYHYKLIELSKKPALWTFDPAKKHERGYIDPQSIVRYDQADKILHALFIILAVLALIPYFGIVTEPDAPQSVAWHYLAAPAFVSIYIGMLIFPRLRKYRCPAHHAGKVRRLPTLIYSALFAAVFTVVASEYLVLANALLPGGKAISVSGTVVGKYSVTGLDRHRIVLDSANTYGYPRILSVSPDKFHELAIGDQAQITTLTGPLKFEYQWINLY